MKKVIIIIFLSLNVFLFSQTKTPNAIDTVKSGRFDVILFNDNSWKYVNSDSVKKVIAIEDSIKLYDYIKTHKFLTCADITFYENWDTINFLSETEERYKIYEDTLLIDLLCSGDFACPYKGKISSRYGWRWGRLHQGIDLQLRVGDTIAAAFNGKVRYTGRHYGYGNVVVISADNGLETVYAHLSKIICSKNQTVAAGEAIGLGGNTGNSTGPHLHFEIRYKNSPINPEFIVDFEKGELLSPTFLIMPNLFSEVREANEAKYHTIRSGDTLGGIAAKYRSSINRICSLNSISQNKILQIGTLLRVR